MFLVENMMTPQNILQSNEEDELIVEQRVYDISNEKVEHSVVDNAKDEGLIVDNGIDEKIVYPI